MTVGKAQMFNNLLNKKKSWTKEDKKLFNVILKTYNETICEKVLEGKIVDLPLN
jgi:hypothetical protein